MALAVAGTIVAASVFPVSYKMLRSAMLRLCGLATCRCINERHDVTVCRRRTVWTIVAALLAAACGGEPTTAESVDASDWSAVMAAADGTVLNLYMWGGSTEINTFVDDTYGQALAEHGVTLNRVPVADTFDAVNIVLGELDAGRHAGGAVDVIWINAENFATMRQAEALIEGWAEQLPNAMLVDWEDPSIRFDAGVPVDGAESPWGSAQFQFVSDSARVDDDALPRSYTELADWIVDNPGRFTYPAPPAFHGTRFLKQWFYEVTGGHDKWIGDLERETYDAHAEQFWQILDDLHPHLWRRGETYPNDIADLDRLFANNEVDFTFTQLPAGIGANIAVGTLPATARPYVFDTGTIADHHYLGIPINATNPAGAMVFANLVLEPHLQAAKLDPANGWGDGLAISLDRLDDADADLLQEIIDAHGPTAVPHAQLERVRMPDSAAQLTRWLEADWDRLIRQQGRR